MQGSSSFDGKLTGNRQMVDRYNEAKGKKKQRPHATGGESGGAHAASGHDEIKQVVMEHGPAHSHHVMDRGEGHEEGRYHVMTHHEDGHVHHADHGTMGDVAEHVAHAHDDTAHLGDMDKEDSEVAGESDLAERAGGSAGSRIGLMR